MSIHLFIWYNKGIFLRMKQTKTKLKALILISLSLIPEQKKHLLEILQNLSIFEKRKLQTLLEKEWQATQSLLQQRLKIDTDGKIRKKLSSAMKDVFQDFSRNLEKSQNKRKEESLQQIEKEIVSL